MFKGRLRSGRKDKKNSKGGNCDGSSKSGGRSSDGSSSFASTPTLRGILKTPSEFESPSTSSVDNSHSKNSKASSRASGDSGNPSASTTEAANKNVSAAPTPVTNGHSHRIRKPRVAFSTVHIREYERTIGDNPSCSSGAPITIGWAHSNEITYRVLDYEMARSAPRPSGELMLTRQAREELLLEWGSNFHDIIDAIRLNVRVKNQRRRTVSAIGTYDRWEEVMEKAGRKLKRTLLLQKNVPKTATTTPTNHKPFAGVHSEPLRLHHASSSPRNSVSSQGSMKPPPVVEAAIITTTSTAKGGDKALEAIQSENARFPSRPPPSPIKQVSEPNETATTTKTGITTIPVILEGIGEAAEEIAKPVSNSTNNPPEQRPHDEADYNDRRSTAPLVEIEVYDAQSLLSDFNGTLSEVDDTTELGDTVYGRNYLDPAEEEDEYENRYQSAPAPEFDDLHGNQSSFWELAGENDGPMIRKRIMPVIIYEDSSSDDRNNGFLRGGDPYVDHTRRMVDDRHHLLNSARNGLHPQQYVTNENHVKQPPLLLDGRRQIIANDNNRRFIVTEDNRLQLISEQPPPQRHMSFDPVYEQYDQLPRYDDRQPLYDRFDQQPQYTGGSGGAGPPMYTPYPPQPQYGFIMQPPPGSDTLVSQWH